MPELPEVETIRRQLSKKIVGKKIEGKEIKRVLRRAKLLIICFEDGSSLLIHLKLTGQLIFGGKPGPYTRHPATFLSLMMVQILFLTMPESSVGLKKQKVRKKQKKN